MIDRCCISLTEKCNLRCRYCHFETEGRRSSELKPEELDSFLSFVKAYVAEHDIAFKVGIVGGGEPTLRFDLLKHTVECLEEDPRIRMYTISNGTRVDDRMMDFLWDHRDSLEFCVSLDGYEALHDKNRVDREGNGTFRTVMETIIRYENRFGHKPAVNCTVTSNSLHHGDELIGFFSDNRFSKVTFSRLFDSEDEVSPGEFASFLRKASESLEVRQLRKEPTYDCAQYGALCGAGRTNVYLASGLVYPCARFAGIERYCLGTAYDTLDAIEDRLKMITPCADGGCYYDRYVRNGGIQ